MKDVMPSLNGITWERLENENSVTYLAKMSLVKDLNFYLKMVFQHLMEKVK